MRVIATAGAIAGFVVLCGLVLAGGNALDRPGLVIDPGDVPAEIPGEADAPSGNGVGMDGEMAAVQEGQQGDAADQTAALQRVAPRDPLSKLSQALPPRPKMPADWKGTILHRAVAPSAGVIQAMGYTVAVAGTDLVAADENCTYEGKSWSCGVYARTAFRAFLRGRSPTCMVPPEADREIVVADCRIGKEDVGDWLVSHGWARAAEGGPYAEVQAKAEEKKLGVFGPPPSKGGLPVLPRSSVSLGSTARDTPSIQILVPDSEEPAEEPAEQATGSTPPTLLPGPFPPAPAFP